MRLKRFSEHALRTLMYLALHNGRPVTIAEIAGAHGFSVNHLMKVVQLLAAKGFVATLRGKRGGLRLSRPAAAIRVGDVIRATEPDLALPLCRQPDGSRGDCLAGLFGTALSAFMAVLDGSTLADLMAVREQLPSSGRQGLDQPGSQASA